MTRTRRSPRPGANGMRGLYVARRNEKGSAISTRKWKESDRALTPVEARAVDEHKGGVVGNTGGLAAVLVVEDGAVVVDGGGGHRAGWAVWVR